MPLLLAIEPDRRQTSRITALAKNTLRAEIVAAETTRQAVAALGGRVPDLILTSLLLSPKDESALADWLRDLDAAGAHVPTLVIPVLGTTRRRPANNDGGLLTRLTGKIGKEIAPDGCDPAVFAAQISEYLERAAEERRAAAIALEDELSADSHQSSVVSSDSTAFEEPAVRFAEPEPELMAAPEPVTFEALEPVVCETTPDVVVAAVVSAQEAEIVVDEPWDEIVLEDESDHSVELAAETIDLEKFVAELNAFGTESDVLSDFVEALEVMAAADLTALVEDEPDRPGAHSAADSELWMPLSFAAAWPQIEGGVVKAAPPTAAAPPQAASAADRRRRKNKAAAPPLQDEWGFFDPERCGFAALLAKLDEISDEEPPDTTTR